MKNFKYQGNYIRILPMNEKHVVIKQKWLKNPIYKFATGTEGKISQQKTKQEKNTFYLIIEENREGHMIGLIKASIQKENILWIHMILIENSYQRKGHGKKAIQILLAFAKKDYHIKYAGLSVYEENMIGRTFWEKLDFHARTTKEVRKKKVIIYQKKL